MVQGEFTKVADNKPPQDTVDWRKHITVVSNDPVIKARIEKTLDYIQNSPQQFSSAKAPDYKFTGRDMIRAIGLYVDQYNDPNNPQLKLLRDFMKDGKLQIVVHDKKFDGSAQTGCFTIQAGTTNLPAQIQIGKDYLRSVELKGPDGKFHPVALEGVMMNELVHAAFRTRDETVSNEIENQLLRTLKHPERPLDMSTENARLNPKPDYVSLLDRAAPAATTTPRP